MENNLINEEISQIRKKMGLDEFFSMPGEREGLPAPTDDDIPTVAEQDFDYSPGEYFMDELQETLFEYWDYSLKNDPEVSPEQFRSDIEEQLGKLVDQYMNKHFPKPDPLANKTKDIADQSFYQHHVNESVIIEKKDIIKNFQKQYGKKKGKNIYYATANKQGRDPETFKADENEVKKD